MICIRVELRPFKAIRNEESPGSCFLPLRYSGLSSVFYFSKRFIPHLSFFPVYFGDDKSDNLDRPKVFRDARRLRFRLRVICKSKHLFLCTYVCIDFTGVHIDPRTDVQTI